MNTELLRLLRDLRGGLFPDAETVNAVLDECIKLAKLSYFEGRVKGGDQPIPDFRNMPDEQVDEFLRSEGIDPKEERAYGRKVIERLKADAGDQPKEPVAWMYEDQLPNTMTQAEYSEWYKKSEVVDGVRMGPIFPPKDQPKALTVDAVMEAVNEFVIWRSPSDYREGDDFEGQCRSRLTALFPSTDTDKLIEAGDSAFALWLAEIKDDGFDESTRYNVAKAAWDAATSKDVGE